jgi:hypothetical protein
MIVTTKKRYCDRCKKEIKDRKYYKGWKITGDRIKIDGVKIKKCDYTDADDAELDLCDDCRKSLAKWMLEFSDDEWRKEYYQK